MPHAEGKVWFAIARGPSRSHIRHLEEPMRNAYWAVFTTATIAMAGIALHGQIGTFAPDWTFKGTALTGMQQVGQAKWSVEGGEIVGTPGSPDGGWLLLPGGYQDVEIAGDFMCAADCKVGV